MEGPQNGWFTVCKGNAHLEMDDLEVPHLWKPPFWAKTLQLLSFDRPSGSDMEVSENMGVPP